MKKAQFAATAPRNYLQKGHSNATSQCNATTSPVLTQIIICHILPKQIRIPAETTAADSWIPRTITSLRNKEILSGKVNCSSQGNPQHITITACYNSTEIKTLCPGTTWRPEKHINVLREKKQTNKQKPPRNIFIPTKRSWDSWSFLFNYAHLGVIFIKIIMSI